MSDDAHPAGGAPAPPTGRSAGAAVIEAVVQAGVLEIPYRRAGRGRPVLFLGTGDGALDRRLFERLSPGRLVIEPVGMPERDAARWLVSLVEGLGLEGLDVVVGPGLADAVEEVLREAPGTLGRVLPLGTVDP